MQWGNNRLLDADLQFSYFSAARDINILIFSIYFQVGSQCSYLIFIHFSLWCSLTDFNFSFLNKKQVAVSMDLRSHPWDQTHLFTTPAY